MLPICLDVLHALTLNQVRFFLINSLPRTANPTCGLHEILIAPNALCRDFEPKSDKKPPIDVMSSIKETL